jgi:hypothetical protein
VVAVDERDRDAVKRRCVIPLKSLVTNKKIANLVVLANSADKLAWLPRLHNKIALKDSVLPTSQLIAAGVVLQ